jgi:hypothetical protein
MDKNLNSNEYFALLAKEDIGAELMRRVDDWYENLGTTGIYRKIQRSYAAYYGYSLEGTGHTASEVIRGGEQGELSLIKVNHFRNLLQHMLVMTTSNRPAMDARAINTDYRSIAQTELANGILDYYLREKKLERCLKDATEYALVFGEGYIRLEWDSSQGDEYNVDPETNRITYTGDIKYSVLNPLSVIKDIYTSDSESASWMIIRHFKNRFELVAKYPEFRDQILEVETKDNIDMQFGINIQLQQGSDLIPVYEFYHEKSDALPQGRQVVFVSKEAVFYDGPLPYREIPVYRICPGNFIGTPHGYTVAFDLLSLQETVDALYSIVVTNQSTFGVQNILLPQGHNMSYTQLAGGLNVLEYDSSLGVKPEALNLTSTPPEIFNFINKVEATMETISGVNSVARGNPEANLRSGNALALIQSMAIQFNSGLQQSYAQLMEDIGTATICTLRDFAATPRVAMIVGKNKRSYLKEFTGNDLDKVNRVVVDLGNPLAHTTAGKLEMANNLVQQGLIKSPEEYIQVMKTGNLDTMLQGEMSQLTNIDLENERLRDGKIAKAVFLDNHILHIKEHSTVINTPEARENPTLIQNVAAHIQEHLELLKTTDPNLLQILGMPSLAQPGQPPEPDAALDAGTAQGTPDAGATNSSVNDVTKTAPTPPQGKLPSLPKSPLTGRPPIIPGVNS